MLPQGFIEIRNLPTSPKLEWMRQHVTSKKNTLHGN